MDGGETKEMMRTTDNKVTFTGIEVRQDIHILSYRNSWGARE